MGIEMSAGRGIAAEDNSPGTTPVTVIPHNYWVSPQVSSVLRPTSSRKGES
jgi:hypothetical protein